MSSLSSGVRRLAQEQLDAHRLAADLDGMPWPGRLSAVRTDVAYQGPAFVDLAIALARERDTSPERAVGWARLAVEAALNANALRAAELVPLAWAALGNAQRRANDLRAARIAFEHCGATRERLADPLDQAETLSLEASFRHQVRELEAAWALVSRARETAAPYATAAVLARFDIKAGMIAYTAERHRLAIELLVQGINQLDPATEPRLALVGGHNLAGALIGIGLTEPAVRGLHQLQEHYRRYADARLRLQRDWLIGRAAIERGHLKEAAARLRSVREGFLGEGLICDAAMVTIDMVLAGVELEGCLEAVAAAAQLLAAAGSPREALASVALLEQVVRQRCERHAVKRAARNAQRLIDRARC